MNLSQIQVYVFRFQTQSNYMYLGQI